jgi:hypothetical protein
MQEVISVQCLWYSYERSLAVCTADEAKGARPCLTAKRASNLLMHFDHAQIAFGMIVCYNRYMPKLFVEKTIEIRVIFSYD